jgi:iron complex transport system substrate-binding protein
MMRGTEESGLELDDLTGAIINAAVRVHRRFGPGLLESAYERFTALALEHDGLRVLRQQAVDVEFEGTIVRNAFRMDLVVEQCVVVEIKSIAQTLPVHKQQLLTYLRLADLPVGLLLNFNAPRLTDGIHRVVNKLPPSASPRLRVNNPNSRSTAEDRGDTRSN